MATWRVLLKTASLQGGGQVAASPRVTGKDNLSRGAVAAQQGGVARPCLRRYGRSPQMRARPAPLRGGHSSQGGLRTTRTCHHRRSPWTPTHTPSRRCRKRRRRRSRTRSSTSQIRANPPTRCRRNVGIGPEGEWLGANRKRKVQGRSLGGGDRSRTGDGGSAVWMGPSGPNTAICFSIRASLASTDCLSLRALLPLGGAQKRPCAALKTGLLRRKMRDLGTCRATAHGPHALLGKSVPSMVRCAAATPVSATRRQESAPRGQPRPA